MTPRGLAAEASFGQGGTLESRLGAAFDLARGWAGPDVLALIVGGSHASREAVWVVHDGTAVTLSDLDLYAVLPDATAVRAAEARAERDRPLERERLLGMGLAAPLEIGFTTGEGLARMVARPGTLDLARRGRVIAGDPAWLERVPRHRPADVSLEERLLLLENRAFELLYALAMRGDRGVLASLSRRHAVFKVALDVAGVQCLAAGHYPDGSAARVALARALPGAKSLPEPPWSEALSWRAGEVAVAEPECEADEWLRTARAWCACWRDTGGTSGVPWDSGVRALAARAPLRRRMRQAVTFAPRVGPGPGWSARLRHAAAGTPVHRLNASAAAVVMAAAGEGGDGHAHVRLLAHLGVIGGEGALDAQARALVRLWDRWVVDGQRTAGWA